MKYLIIPILKLLWCSIIFIIYAFCQIIYIFWHAKPHKDLIKRLTGEDYYCVSHRFSLYTTRFEVNKYKITVKPKSLIEWCKWTLKYGPTGEVLEISEKERYYYERYLENIQNGNTKIS